MIMMLAVSAVCSASNGKVLDEEEVKLTTNQLIVVEKHNGADVLLYQVVAEKKPAARFVYLFKLNGEKPLLNDFSVMLPQQKEAAKEEAKK